MNNASNSKTKKISFIELMKADLMSLIFLATLLGLWLSLILALIVAFVAGRMFEPEFDKFLLPVSIFAIAESLVWIGLLGWRCLFVRNLLSKGQIIAADVTSVTKVLNLAIITSVYEYQRKNYYRQDFFVPKKGDSEQIQSGTKISLVFDPRLPQRAIMLNSGLGNIDQLSNVNQ